jgi:hypothetical protein
VSDDQDPVDWETVTRVLRHSRQKITLCVGALPGRRSEEDFARAIRRHPTIQRIETTYDSFQFESFGCLVSALASLPALESAIIEHDTCESEHKQNPEVPEHITTVRYCCHRPFDMSNSGNSTGQIRCVKQSCLP